MTRVGGFLGDSNAIFPFLTRRGEEKRREEKKRNKT